MFTLLFEFNCFSTVSYSLTFASAFIYTESFPHKLHSRISLGVNRCYDKTEWKMHGNDTFEVF